MPFFKSMPPDAGPPNGFNTYPGAMSQALLMQRPVQGHGFTPLPQETSVKNAQARIKLGYLNLYPQFRDKK